MRIVLATSEAVPYSKTGGLADMVSSLAKAVRRRGHDVWLITPHYPRAGSAGDASIGSTGQHVQVQVGSQAVYGEVLQSKLPRSHVSVFLIDQPGYFDRRGVYQENGSDFKDNCARFVFFSRAVMQTIQAFDLRPDVIHAHDWQTGLVPALLDIEYRQRPGFADTASVVTIHNMAFQGQFWHWDMELTGLDWKYFNWRQMESFGHLNLLKTGIVFADMLTTVSPTYAREMQSPEFGCGLEGVVQYRQDQLVGILNGVDTEVWDPETDPSLAANYSPETVRQGKPACKTALQRSMRLPVRNDVPLFAMISRLTDQKGLDLIESCVPDLLRSEIQMAFLGSGEGRYESLLTRLAYQFPEKVAVRIGFDETLAHQMEAGADAYLMPSRFEPCGLNQMYSLMYGTVPIVRAVGGLADSVVDATPESLASGTANGISFDEYDDHELFRSTCRAVELYRRRPKWDQMVGAGMRKDWSWNHSAAEYAAVYERAVASRRQSSGNGAAP